MLLKVCPRCRKLIPQGKSYCTACEAEHKVERAKRAERYRAASNQRYNARRDQKHKRFYNSKAWKSLRSSMMAAASWECEVPGCHATAVELHHDPPLSTDEGWKHRLDPEHCHPLCLKHHNEAHNRFRSKEDAKGNRLR